MPSCLKILSILCVLSSAAIADDLREWTDVTGKHKVQATFVRLEGDAVVLQSRDGKTIKIPRSKLCAQDQRYCQERGTTAPSTPSSSAELNKAIDELRTASDVVLMLEDAASSKGVSKAVADAASALLPEWKKRATEGAINYGGKWMSGEQIAAAKQEADDLMAQATKMIAIGNHALAREMLLKASKADGEGVQADFTLGMLHALIGGHPDEARTRFQVCVRRLERIGQHRTAMQNANLRAALNNIAITEVRANRASSAISRWGDVVAQGNVAPEIIQNIGRLSDLAAARDFVQVPQSTVKLVSTLYAKAASENSAREYDPSTGWLYIPYLCEAPPAPPKEPQPGKVTPVAKKNSVVGSQELRVFASGSGFAVTDELIITNRHVAEGAHAFKLGNTERSAPANLSGELIAVSKTHDLALLRFPGLKAPPIKLRDELPRLAADVRVLGFPESDFLGDSLKVTAGSIAGLPQPNAVKELHRMILLDAVANPGNSGGPVIDSDGRVVGALTLGINLQQSYTAAVPAEDIRTFIREHVSDFSSADAGSPNSGSSAWEDTVDTASKSTFQVLVLGSPQPASWVDDKGSTKDPERPKRPTGWNGLEDPWCMHCSGLGHISCSIRGCRLGVIVGRRQEVIATPNGPLSRWVPTQNRCDNCNGSGRVACPHCQNGFDPAIR